MVDFPLLKAVLLIWCINSQQVLGQTQALGLQSIQVQADVPQEPVSYIDTRIEEVFPLSKVPRSYPTNSNVASEFRGHRRLQSALYQQVESGSCATTSGCSLITTESDCDAAAAYLQLPDQSSTSPDFNSAPGCSLSHGQLYFNADSSSTYLCSSSYPCLCSCGTPAPTSPTSSPTTGPTPIPSELYFHPCLRINYCVCSSLDRSLQQQESKEG
ncbi:hypothetical protein CYMTET_52202 [Cymbomonas tetramitiformis]|uniref:Uncharacterized protein n=1 Tax=Cymbomonas tetramitiformis TaxID=36881 RepID=A0AAE0BJG4_9CHLO|nr:hypothetical protein CYMTET_52202 [Cymbomonas tetramitiformis]